MLPSFVYDRRMDRLIDGYMFSLKYFCRIINGLRFSEVIVLDPHSSVSTSLLNRCCKSPALQKNVYNVLKMSKADFVFYPDKGACQRYGRLIKIGKTPYFYGEKKRDVNTGLITSYKLFDCPKKLKGRDVLIIDDLCSKGFTFHKASEKLKECGARNVFLYVSHCENSIYDGLLLFKNSCIDKIFTTDTILTNWTSNKIVKI